MRNDQIALEIAAAERKLADLRAQLAKPEMLTGWWMRCRDYPRNSYFLGAELKTTWSDGHGSATFILSDGRTRTLTATNNSCSIYWGTFPASDNCLARC